MLAKAHRIRKTHEYNVIYKNSKRLSSKYFLFYCRYVSSNQKESPDTIKYPRFGFVASKKVGNAIKRNRAKRILREATRSTFPHLKNTFESIIIASPQIFDANFNELQEELKMTFKKVGVYY